MRAQANIGSQNFASTMTHMSAFRHGIAAQLEAWMGGADTVTVRAAWSMLGMLLSMSVENT